MREREGADRDGMLRDVVGRIGLRLRENIVPFSLSLPLSLSQSLPLSLLLSLSSLSLFLLDGFDV